MRLATASAHRTVSLWAATPLAIFAVLQTSPSRARMDHAVQPLAARPPWPSFAFYGNAAQQELYLFQFAAARVT
jgi:hypothetical protein